LILLETLIILFLLVRHPSTPQPPPPISNPIPEPSPSPISLPLAVIDIHTSSATFNRAAFFHDTFYLNDSFIANGTFHFRVVVSKEATIKPDVWPVSRVSCPDAHEKLPCRVDASYPNFLADFPSASWLFRAEDDCFINTTLLYQYIMHLNSIYQPHEHIVFRAHANPERFVNWYIHGGSGWLMSRACVDLHVKLELSLEKLLPGARYHQQDTAESIIVRALFPHASLWDEMGFEGFACGNCDNWAFNGWKWESLNECPANVVAIRVSGLWAFHTASLQDRALQFVKRLSSAPEDIMMMRDNGAQRMVLCRKGPKTIVWNYTRRNLAFLTKDDVPQPLIDYKTLHNDNIG
jgi:hypothetical protein